MIFGRIWPVPLSLVIFDQVTCHFRSIYCITLNFLQDLGESPTSTNRFSFHNTPMISYDWDAIPNLVFRPWQPQSVVTKNIQHLWDSILLLSYGGALIPLSVMTPSGPILTEHHAFATSGPRSLKRKSRLVTLEFCCKAPARAWQETNGLRNTMKHTEHTSRKVAKSPRRASHL